MAKEVVDSHPYGCSRPGWMGLQANWSSGRHPCQQWGWKQVRLITELQNLSGWKEPPRSPNPAFDWSARCQLEHGTDCHVHKGAFQPKVFCDLPEESSEGTDLTGNYLLLHGFLQGWFPEPATSGPIGTLMAGEGRQQDQKVQSRSRRSRGCHLLWSQSHKLHLVVRC